MQTDFLWTLPINHDIFSVSPLAFLQHFEKARLNLELSPLELSIEAAAK